MIRAAARVIQRRCAVSAQRARLDPASLRRQRPKAGHARQSAAWAPSGAALGTTFVVGERGGLRGSPPQGFSPYIGSSWAWSVGSWVRRSTARRRPRPRRQLRRRPRLRPCCFGFRSPRRQRPRLCRFGFRVAECSPPPASPSCPSLTASRPTAPASADRPPSPRCRSEPPNGSRCRACASLQCAAVRPRRRSTPPSSCARHRSAMPATLVPSTACSAQSPGPAAPRSGPCGAAASWLRCSR